MEKVEALFVNSMMKALAKCKLKKPLALREVLSKIDYTNKDDVDNIPMQHNAKTIERFRYIKGGL